MATTHQSAVSENTRSALHVPGRDLVANAWRFANQKANGTRRSAKSPRGVHTSNSASTDDRGAAISTQSSAMKIARRTNPVATLSLRALALDRIAGVPSPCEPCVITGDKIVPWE